VPRGIRPSQGENHFRPCFFFCILLCSRAFHFFSASVICPNFGQRKSRSSCQGLHSARRQQPRFLVNTKRGKLAAACVAAGAFAVTTMCAIAAKSASFKQQLPNTPASICLRLPEQSALSPMIIYKQLLVLQPQCHYGRCLY